MRLSLAVPGIVASTLAALLLLFGLVAASPTLVLLAACASFPLVLDVLLGAAAPLRFREGDLRLGWRLADRRARHLVDRPIDLEVTLRNPSAPTLAIDHAELFAPARIRVHRHTLRLPTVPPRSEVRHVVRVTPLAPGKLVLHGILVWIATPLGFCRYRLYFPHPLRIHVVPTGLRARLPRHHRALTEVRGTLPRLRARFAAGDETDLRDIRDHHPGDSFRHIAWRPSARTGRLLTKVYERYLPRRHLLAVDASASTLRRVNGRAPLDDLAADAYALALAALRNGDTVGLVLFDQRIVRRLPPTGGLAAAERILDALLDAYQPVDADAVDAAADDVAQAVGRYLLLHHGIETRDPSLRGSPHDPDLVAEAVRRIGVSPRAALRDVLAEHPDDEALRRFCLDRGIELPPQERYDPHGRATGLGLALEEALGSPRTHQVHLLTDLLDADAWNGLAPPLLRLRRERTAVRCILPPPSPRDDDPLHQVEAAVRRTRLRRLHRFLHRLGVETVATARVPPA